jgi:isoamylase
MGASPTSKVHPGSPHPLGAHYDGAGTNFSVFSEVAERVELCLFSASGREHRVPMNEMTGFCWHAYLPGVGPGQRYGYRIHGPHAPRRGHRCNGKKLLLDPYAKAICGAVHWDEALYSHRFEQPEGPLNRKNSARFAPRSVVVNPYFDWKQDRPPGTPWHRTVIYELHVKGFTARHPAVPAHQRGTYAGLAHPAVIDYLGSLGVTAVELMPVHEFVHDQHLVDRGLKNYWGYNSIGYFAPHHEYASWGHGGEQVNEFKHMVQALHAAGIEVILDVVYNHTAEGNHLGPTLCFRGLDNAAYYRLVPNDARYYFDFTGCGNSLNMRHPHVLQLIMDSLRYWVTEMHVDGFRFDLAAALARELFDVDKLSAFLDLIQQDPVVGRVKLIAEPWDVGEGGYQVGNFPPLWSEWNGKYRDTVRDLWRGHDQTLAEFAFRFTGSSDLYELTGRRPFASVNFVTAHDGFTLRDLVSYDHKHNEENLEENRDGEDHNRSWNCGVEGETDDAAVNALRARQQRNFLCTLMLSQGVPMLLAGDERGRSQRGNNNAYCQDGDLTWLDWEHFDSELLAFWRRLVKLRQEHPVFRRRGWFVGKSIRGTNRTDIGWFRPDGDEMTEEDWNVAHARAVSVFLNGQGIRYPDPIGQPIVDDDFFIVFNAHHGPTTFVLPDSLPPSGWQLEIDTAEASPLDGATIAAEGRSVVVLRRPR